MATAAPPVEKTLAAPDCNLLGNEVVLSSDSTTLATPLLALRDGGEIREKIRTFVEEWRDQKRVSRRATCLMRAPGAGGREARLPMRGRHRRGEHGASWLRQLSKGQFHGRFQVRSATATSVDGS
jgi:hypothetical protein